MKGPIKILLLGAGGLIAVVAVCFFCLREKEPSYNGRTLSEWLDRFDENIPPGRLWPSIEPIDATDAIKNMGITNGPLLAHWLVDGATTDEKIRQVTRRNPFLQRIASPFQKRAERKRLRGLHGLKIVGTNASAAIPILNEAIRTQNQVFILNDVVRALSYVEPRPTNSDSYQ